MLTRRVKSAFLLFFEWLATIYLFTRYWLIGRSYTSFYARMMDMRVRRHRQWGLNLEKGFQLAYLKAHGLTTDMRFLDYGCGAVAAGRHFMEYLEEGRYVGVDISPDVLEEGRRRTAEWGLMSKNPTLLLDDGTLSSLAGRQFDIIWAQSVLTHMPPEDIERLLRKIPPLMSDSGAFYATISRDDRRVRSRRMKDWFYPVSFIQQAAQDGGLTATVMPDWRHPNDPDGIDTLVRFTRAGV